MEALDQALTAFSLMLANAPPISQKLVDGWMLVLRHANLTPEEVMVAIPKVLATAEFFPQPSIFLKAARPALSDDLLVEQAWQRVRRVLSEIGSYGSVRDADFGFDPQLTWAVEALEWHSLSERLVDEHRAIIRAEFVRLYRLALAEGSVCRYIPGILERQNRGGKIPLTPSLVGRPDWDAMPGQGQAALPAPPPPQVADFPPIRDLIRALPPSSLPEEPLIGPPCPEELL